MLTLAELDYMSRDENKIPYPGNNYAIKALKEIKNAIIIFNKFYRDKSYEIELCNGNTIDFEIKEANLSHMLGIIYPRLKDAKIVPEYTTNATITSFDLINKIAEDPEKFISINEKNNYLLFNPYRVKTRSEIFGQFAGFENFNFGCIEFDREKADSLGYHSNMKSSNFLYIESNNPKAPYFMLGLAENQSEENNRYENGRYVETLFPCTLLKKMFKQQTIAYPIMISTSTPSQYKQKESPASQKIINLEKCKKLIQSYDYNLNFTSDYISLLSQLAVEQDREKLLKK